MLVLVLNCGSSSVKFQVIDTEGDRSLARGLIEKIGGQSIVTLHGEGRSPYEAAEAVSDHEAAVRRVIEWIRAAPSPLGGAGGFDAVGHRVVHGGARFVEPTVIDDDVVRAIEVAARGEALVSPRAAWTAPRRPHATASLGSKDCLVPLSRTSSIAPMSPMARTSPTMGWSAKARIALRNPGETRRTCPRMSRSW